MSAPVTQIQPPTPRSLGELRRSLYRRLGFAAQTVEPPGVNDLLDDLINDAQRAVYRRYGYGVYGMLDHVPELTGDDDTTVVDGEGVFLLALANAKSHYGQDGKPYYDQFEVYVRELLQRSPLNLASIVDDFLQQAQETLYRRYDVLRTERIFTWPLQAGVRMYDLPANAEECSKKLDPRKLTWVGIECEGTWRPLVCGIPPELYSHERQGRPERYEIRQCIEVWPVPEESSGSLRIKGRFGLDPFTHDNDATTIDSEAVFLLALANAKAHFGRPDGGNYMQQLQVYIGDLVAGSHQTKRYLPGRLPLRNAVPPRIV